MQPYATESNDKDQWEVYTKIYAFIHEHMQLKGTIHNHIQPYTTVYANVTKTKHKTY